MARLHETRGRISAAGWGIVLIACDLVEVIRRRSLIYATSAATLAILLVIVLPGPGGGNATAEVPATPATATESSSEPAGSSDPADSLESATEDRFVEVGGYSLTLPDGWHATPRPPGAAYATTSGDGLATTTLWIRRTPGVDFDAFEKRSQRSLAKLGQNVTVLSEVKGATVADSSVELGADVPVGGDLTPGDQQLISTYRVTLRASGPYRFYLATTIQPGAPASTLADVEELGRNLRPWLSGAS